MWSVTVFFVVFFVRKYFTTKNTGTDCKIQVTFIVSVLTHLKIYCVTVFFSSRYFTTKNTVTDHNICYRFSASLIVLSILVVVFSILRNIAICNLFFLIGHYIFLIAHYIFLIVHWVFFYSLLCVSKYFCCHVVVNK